MRSDFRRRTGLRVAYVVLGVLLLGANGAVPAAAIGSGANSRVARPIAAQRTTSESIHGATFDFAPGVSELDRNDVIEGIRLGQRAIEMYLGVPRLPNLHITVLGQSIRDTDTVLASTSGSEIEVYTGSEIWQTIAPIERVETLVHELAHVYQNLMVEDSLDVEPSWFAEGTAEAIAFQTVIPMGVSNQDEVYSLMSYMLTRYPTDTPLSELEGYDTMNSDAYPVVYFAVQYLLASRGLSISAIGEVYDGLAAGKTFADAFESVFGVSLQDFYAEFEAWRPGIVQTSELDDDFWDFDLETIPSALTLAPMLPEVPGSGQLMVSGQTEPGVACTLDMTIGTTVVSRPAESNGAGEVYWLVSMPDGTLPGSGSLSASCGGTPVIAEFAVTA